ncbi:MAG: hypothetical protein FJX71_01530 [Alphaproteobacteria bacterium]|nr:hypothetical protein [Alphaproteobacteria bacterium]
MKGLYAIPSGVPFLSTLVEGLLNEAVSDPLSLARSVVILPTRRGCLALHQAFTARKSTSVLPRIIALADIEEGMDLPGYVPPEILPPSLPNWQRLGLLSHLVLKFEEQKEGGIGNPARAVRLTQELMNFVDEVETSKLNLENLKTLVGEDYAAHWQLTLDFLKILTDQWPSILSQAGFMEPAARKRLILEQVASYWHPTDPVILAGTTGTRPATAALMGAILQMNKGCVVLPYVDMSLFESDHVTLPATHPQHTLMHLIQKLGIPQLWPSDIKNIPSRSIFLSSAMTASPQENWSISQEIAEEVLSSIEAIEASSIEEEANQIALIMRYELEKESNTIALVTPDRELAWRVKTALKRWELHANVSSGFPLKQSVVGRFLLLTSLLVDSMKPTDLLALLKHPLYMKGKLRGFHLNQTRQFEREVIRGQTVGSHQDLNFPGSERCAPLRVLNDGRHHSFSEFLKTHIAVAENLVGDNENSNEGVSLLWSEDDGQVAFSLFQTLLEYADTFPSLTAKDYPAFLRNLMAEEVVREKEGIGSQLMILGTLEARLLQANVVILGGLNEDVWPSIPQDDPWLSRSMREGFGLPPLERKIGLSAHDFCAAFSAPRVYLTRSLKRDGTPTLPSRWWQRMAALLATAKKEFTSSQPWGAWASQLDQPMKSSPFLPPSPCPPLKARPCRLSVTAVETLLRDPYSVYAKTILKLYPLDPVEADLSPLKRGQAIHEVLDAFVKSGVDPHAPGAMKLFEDLGEKAFGHLLRDVRAQAFWWSQFQRIGEWFLSKMSEEKPLIQEIKTEVEGSLEIPTSNGPILLTTKADRIDILSSGFARIIDYKTGSLPTKKEVTQGYAPQLSLEGLILREGGFSSLPPLITEALCYWRMTGRFPVGECVSFDNAEALIEAAKHGVEGLFEHFLAKETPFYACPNSFIIPNHHEYAHLERLKEWGY